MSVETMRTERTNVANIIVIRISERIENVEPFGGEAHLARTTAKPLPTEWPTLMTVSGTKTRRAADENRTSPLRVLAARMYGDDRRRNYDVDRLIDDQRRQKGPRAVFSGRPRCVLKMVYDSGVRGTRVPATVARSSRSVSVKRSTRRRHHTWSHRFLLCSRSFLREPSFFIF